MHNLRPWFIGMYPISCMPMQWTARPYLVVTYWPYWRRYLHASTLLIRDTNEETHSHTRLMRHKSTVIGKAMRDSILLHANSTRTWNSVMPVLFRAWKQMYCNYLYVLNYSEQICRNVQKRYLVRIEDFTFICAQGTIADSHIYVQQCYWHWQRKRTWTMMLI